MSKTKQAQSVSGAVRALFTAYSATIKTDGADYKAVAAMLRAAPLNDAEWIGAFRKELFATFGEAHKDAAQIRLNIVNNARRVAYGGSKDGKAIRGKGHAAMLDVVASVESVRELRRAMSEAVPEALKAESGGTRAGSGRKGTKNGTSKANAISIPKVATREEAFAAARKVLEFVRDKFTKPSEVELTNKVNACIEALAK